jgi:CRISPR-associated protein Cas2
LTPGEKKSWYIICYDVRDDKRLRKVAKHLKGYGERIQFSVFRCRLSKRGVERLKWELTKIMDLEDDLLVIGLCSNCARSICSRDSKGDWSVDQPTFQIV